MSAARKSRARSVLRVLVAMFLFSGALRAVESAQAYAELPPLPAAAPPPETAPEVDALIEALNRREADLASREAALAEGEAKLAAGRGEVQAMLDELKKAREDLTATLSLADKAAETDIARLVAMYEAMKPKDAAPLFTEMAPEFAANFLARMRPEAAAAIIAGLEPKVAYAISVHLASRNASAPKS